MNLYTDPPANLHIRVQDFYIFKNLILKLNDEINRSADYKRGTFKQRDGWLRRGMGGCVEGWGAA